MSSTAIATGAVIVAAQPAYAQSEASEASQPVVVTGSRIVRQDLDAPSPTTVVGGEAIEMSGNFTIENTLNEFPQLAAGNTSSVNSGGGSGVLTANLRGLGSTRTLVLVNDRRFIPANSNGVVDLSSIPDALIERVDIITGGASAVYGSDAIAGAVNFVLKNDFEGLEAKYMYGITEEGDGGSHKVDVTFGGNFADGRGNAVMSLSYTKQKPVFQQNRPFSAPPLDTVNGELVPGGSGNVPGTRIGLSSGVVDGLVGVAAPTDGCTSVTGIYFAENGTPTTYCTPENAFDYAEGNYLLRPLERYQITGLGHYDVTDSITAYAEGYFMTNRNAFQQAPAAFSPVTPSYPGGRTLVLPNYATNPVLSDAVRDFFVNNAAVFDPDSTGDALIVGAGRRADELGPRNYAYERTSYDLTGGLRGDLDIMGRNWRWDAFYQFQRTRTDQNQVGQISSARLSQALNATMDGDNVVCVDQSRGCVPVSIFGYDSITPEAGAFISPNRDSYEIFVRQVAGGSLSGELFDLPAGAVGLALGVEYRKDKYEFTPSPQDIAGEYGSTSQKATGGEYDVTEFFGEIRIPILADMPFAETLSLEGAARYSDYSTVGGVFAWKVGAEYAPVDWLRFRGAFNRAIRAPNLNELYSPITQGYTGGNDPCAAAENPTAAQKDFCVVQGVPASDIDNFAQGTVGYNYETGGNPDLGEEKSSTYTIGAVIRPDFLLPRLNLTVDYFNVEVKDAIASINGDQTLRDCFAKLDVNAVTCQAIHRLSNGQIDYVETNLANLGKLKVNGLDTQVDYNFDLPSSLGIAGSPSLTLQWVGSWLFERSIQTLSGETPLDCAGLMGGGCGGGTGEILIPDFKMNISATYQSGPVTFRAASRMIGGFDLSPNVTAAVESIPAEWYVDLFAKVDVLENVELFGGINNLTNNQPTILGTALAGDANVDVGLYDVLGRRYVMGIGFSF